jgi:hypothetical protein
MVSLKALEKKISNIDSSLWYLLSILDPDIHKSLKEKLVETASKRDAEELPNYIEYANLIMDAHDEDAKELFLHLVDLLLKSPPAVDKILDVNKILVLENHLDVTLVRKLEKFHSACLKGNDDEKD